MGKKLFWTNEELLNLPKTIGEAIYLNSRYFYTGRSCKKGHVFPRHSDSGKCVECRRENLRKTQSKSRKKENQTQIENYKPVNKIGTLFI